MQRQGSRGYPLPSLDGPRGHHHRAGGGGGGSRPPSSSTATSELQAFADSSRSTSASSQVRSERSLGLGRGNFLSELTAASPQEPQVDECVKAMLPILKRAMVSSNKAVVQASLDQMCRIQRMFGQEAIDEHVQYLGDALEEQRKGPGGSVRTAIVLEALTGLCSQDAGMALKRRFLEHVSPRQVLAT